MSKLLELLAKRDIPWNMDLVLCANLVTLLFRTHRAFGKGVALFFRPVFPQSKVLVKFVHETGEKRSESFNFQGKCPQEISRKILDIFHTAPNKVLSLLQLWEVGIPTFSAPKARRERTWEHNALTT